MGANCAPLLAVIVLSSYELESIHFLLLTGKKQLASRIVHKQPNQEFENYLGQMLPVELKTKYTTNSNTSASIADLGGVVNFTLQLETNEII